MEGQLWCLLSSQTLSACARGPKTTRFIIWGVKPGKVVRGMMGHRVGITTLNVSSDGGTMVLTGSQDRLVKVWDARTGSCTRTLPKGHKDTIRSLRFFDNKRSLFASDGTILSSSVSKFSSDVSVWDLTENCSRPGATPHFGFPKSLGAAYLHFCSGNCPS